MKVQCVVQKFTSCCIAQDLKMLHIKVFISNAVKEVIQANSEFASYVQMKLLWIPEGPGCSLVVEHITVGCSFLQLFEVEPKHYVLKMGWGSTVRIWPITEYPRFPGGGVMTLHNYGYLPPEFLKSYPVSEWNFQIYTLPRSLTFFFQGFFLGNLLLCKFLLLC